jgi:hypothetical protein
LRADFVMSRKRLRQESIRRYRRLHESFSVHGDLWSTPEVVRSVYSKLDDSIFKCRLRVRMKPNDRFHDHRDSALLRNLGSIESATEVYQAELERRRSTRFRAGFFLAQFEEDLKECERMQPPAKARKKYSAELITPTGDNTGRLWFADDNLFCDSKEQTVTIPISKIRKLFLRRRLHLDTALELYMTYPQSFFLNFPDGKRELFLKSHKLRTLKYCQKTSASMKSLAPKAAREWQNAA